MAKRPCVLNGLEKRCGGGGRQGGPWRQGPVTKIIDRRQRAVMRAGMGGPASPGESTPSCGGGPGAPRRQKASRGDQRQRADAMSRVSPPNTVCCSETIAPAPPGCRGSTDSHFSGSRHRWDGRCSQRWSRRHAVGTNERRAGDEHSRQASAGGHDGRREISLRRCMGISSSSPQVSRPQMRGLFRM